MFGLSGWLGKPNRGNGVSDETLNSSDIRIRWLIRGDMDSILKIETENFSNPWTSSDFSSMLRERNCIGLVAEVEEELLGYAIYLLQRGYLEILNIAVKKGFQNLGVGTAILNKAKSKLTGDRRRIKVAIRESNLVALNWFKKRGFFAYNLVPNYWADCDEDAIVMEYFREE